MGTSFRNRVRGWSAVLGRVPSLFYAAVYCLCIPVFALLYLMSPDGFYHSTVQYEVSLRNDTWDIQHDLARLIIEELHRRSPQWIVSSNGWETDARGLYIENLVCDETKCSFSLRSGSALTKGKGADKEYRSLPYLKVEVMMKSIEHIEKKPNVNIVTGMNPVHIKNRPQCEFDPEAFFPSRASSDAQQPCIELPRELYFRMEQLRKANKGFPGRSSGGFPRMLYFSVVTITTLGYGDIVPLSDDARMLVALETFCGVILIGLFLNALSHEIGQNTVPAKVVTRVDDLVEPTADDVRAIAVALLELADRLEPIANKDAELKASGNPHTSDVRAHS